MHHIDLTKDRQIAQRYLEAELRRIDGAGGRGWPDDRSPFPGLRPYELDMHQAFFGRSREVASLREILRSKVERAERNLVLLVGPSGCGKSSVLRAGFLPALADETDWSSLTPIFPGGDPVAVMTGEGRYRVACGKVCAPPLPALHGPLARCPSDAWESVNMNRQTPRFDVCLSFAGEDRQYVERIAQMLRERAVKVFYDRYEQSELWGKNLYTHLSEVYRSGRYCVIFISEHYAGKVWTNHERESAQARAFEASEEYILPARFDDTEVPGILPTVGYMDLRQVTEVDLVDAICFKLAANEVGPPDSENIEMIWSSRVELPIGSTLLTIDKLQELPLPYDGILEDLIQPMAESVARNWIRDGSEIRWTCGLDRDFDRIYATSSIVTALAQWGVGPSDAVLAAAINYLRRFPHSSIDNRAATLALMSLGRLEEDELAAFQIALSAWQITDSVHQACGSFLLPQGPAPEDPDLRENWTGPLHADGASFHACHIADALLHIPPEFRTCRERARTMLEAVRGFLTRAYRDHDGWLIDLAGQPSKITLYSYALAPSLRIPLPSNWRLVGASCRPTLDDPPTLRNCFGIMNAAYSASRIRDPEYTSEVQSFLADWLSLRRLADDTEGLDAPELAAYTRAIMYGIRLVQSDLMLPLKERFVHALAAIAARGEGHTVF